MTNQTTTLVTSPPPDGYSVTWSAAQNKWLPTSPAAIVQAGGGTSPAGPAGGDLGGTFPNPVVLNIHGVSVAPSPAAAQVLVATSNTASAWVTISGDSTVTSGGVTTNIGLRGISVPVPSGANTVLTYNAGAFSWGVGGGGGGSLTVENQGVGIGTYTTINFTGSGVVASNGGGAIANITIAGGNIYIVHSTITVTTYTVVNADQFIPVDSTSNVITITLPASPASGEWHIIADISGAAFTNNITINGNGKNIVGASSFTISAAFNSIYVAYNGTNWSII
jgi:hypothetical protein